MSFRDPGWLWLLVPVVGLVGAYLLALRRRGRYAVRFAALPMLERVAPRGPGWRRHLPAAAFLLSLIVLALAIARPEVEVRVPRERATVLVALDVSTSMRATDVSPSRLAVAQSAATEFVRALPERFNVGLVAFSGTPVLAAPPTTDRQQVVEAIDELRLSDQTAIGEAVFTSLDSIAGLDRRAADDPPPARIVLLSDGGNNSGRSLEQAAEEATNADVPVSTIAYGTPDGTIELEGQQVPVPVDAPALQQLADGTGGMAYAAASGTELREVYADLESSIGWTMEQRDVTQVAVGAALVTAVLAGLMSLLWFARLP